MSRIIEGWVVEYAPKEPDENKRELESMPESWNTVKVFLKWMEVVNHSMLADDRQFSNTIRKCRLEILDPVNLPSTPNPVEVG